MSSKTLTFQLHSLVYYARNRLSFNEGSLFLQSMISGLDNVDARDIVLGHASLSYNDQGNLEITR